MLAEAGGQSPKELLHGADLEKRCGLLRLLLLDQELVSTEGYEAALLAAEPLYPPSRTERLASW